MTLVATWRSDGTHASLRDEDDGLWATLTLVDDWYPPGRREPMRAWVVEWICRSDDESQMARTRLDVVEQPAADEDTMARLSEAGAVAARAAAPAEPAPFGHAATGLAQGSEIHKRIELISHAIQEAEGRLNDAARVVEPWGAHRVLIALTEAVGWVRALDDAMNHIWRRLSDERRAEITARISEVLERPGWDPQVRSVGKSTEKQDRVLRLDPWIVGAECGAATRGPSGNALACRQAAALWPVARRRTQAVA